MNKIIQLIFPRNSLVAILGLYSAAVGISLILFYWGAAFAADTLNMTESEIKFKGLALIIGTTIVRHILIANGKDIAANWINREK